MRVFYIFCLLVLVGLSGPGCGKAQSRSVIATIGDEELRVSDLQFYLQQIGMDPLMDKVGRWIENRDQEALSGFENYLKDLAFKLHFARTRLVDYPYDEEQEFRLREDLWEYAVTTWNKLFRSTIEIRSDELEASYEQYQDDFTVPEQRKIAVLFRGFLPGLNQEEVVNFLTQLRQRPDFSEHFEDYVTSFSQLRGALQGGVVNYFPRGTYHKYLEEAAFGLQKGEVSEVFSDNMGAYVVQCLDIQNTRTLTLEEASPSLEQALFRQKYQQELQQRLQLLRTETEWELNPTAPQGVLLQVGDFTLTSSTLLALRPELQSLNAVQLQNYLEPMLVAELVLREMQQQVFRHHKEENRRFEIIKAVNSFNVWFEKEWQEKIQESEEEIRAYYEQYREYYHYPAPRKFAFLLFPVPEREAVSGDAHFLMLNQQWLLAQKFRNLVEKEEKDFRTSAEAFLRDHPGLRYGETDFVEQFPADWKTRHQFIESYKGRLSLVTESDSGPLVFTVLEVGTPRLYSFEEARPKVERVVSSRKRREYYGQLREQWLAEHHFSIVK